MPFPIALANLETAVLQACATEEEWPAQIAAGIYAGIDYAISHPEVAETLIAEARPDPGGLQSYESVIGRLTGFLRVGAPRERRLPVSTDEALVAGLVGLVGDHLRLGRLERLENLRPDLVLLTLLPYLGFAEARNWANKLEEHGAGA